jgi:cobyrinic acid a,c-diamide synthase
MGLFDGARPTELRGSTAEIALLLQLPVILVIDVRAMAGSAAALVKGFCEFNRKLEIIGVIANRTGSENHRRIIEQALAAAGLPPLLGALPKDAVPTLPERHLGLVSAAANDNRETYQKLGQAVAQHIDLEQLLTRCRRPRPQAPATAPKVSLHAPVNTPSSTARPHRRLRLGLARDQAFQFYYIDNLDLLAAADIELVPFSPLTDTRLPPALDGLWLGGGYPELYAARLSQNLSLRNEIKDFADAGGAVYGECGGLMYLGRELVDLERQRWPMCGVLALSSEMGQRRFRLGYTEAQSRTETIFGPSGTGWRGHRFHCSKPSLAATFPEAPLACRRPDQGQPEAAGYRRGRVLATYIHAHFGNRPELAANWATFLRERERGL